MKKVFVSAVVGCLFSSTVFGAGLINGSFEVDAGGYTQGLSSLPSSWGWVVGAGDIDHVNISVFGFPPSDGQMYIDLSGYTPGTIYQDFIFPSSGEWAISFDMEANPAETILRTMNVEFGEVGSLVVVGSYGVLPNGGSWVNATTPSLIVDDSTTYRLQFTSTTTGSASGVLLDNVQLTPVPEPSTFALVGLSAVTLIMFRRNP